MRVLVVAHGFPPASQGGSEIYAARHARALVEQHGDTVQVLTRESDPRRPEHDVRTEHRDGLTITWINNTFRSARSFADTYRSRAIDTIASRVIDELAPDVAHIHHLTCLSTSIVDELADHDVPIVFTLHDYWLLCHRGQLLDLNLDVCSGPEPDGCPRCIEPAVQGGAAAYAAAAALRTVDRWLPASAVSLARRVGSGLAARTRPAVPDVAAERLRHMRRVASRVTCFLAPSAHLRERFIAFGFPPDRITLSPYGFDPAPFRDLIRPPSDQLRLGFLGSLMVSKAPHLLLEAFARLAPGVATVDLYGAPVDYHGDASYRGTLAPLLTQPGVTLRGPVSHDEVPAALASLDVLVVPSIWPENRPLVIHEAFLAGVPVVASDTGGIPESVVDGRSGLLFRRGDASDLARALDRLVSEPALLATLRQGIPSVRTIEDDVSTCRALYRTCRSAVAAAARPRRVVAVVLHYHDADETVLTVRSLLASRRRLDEIVVVDNTPTGEGRSSLGPLLDRVTYLGTGCNLGFSGGMNVGLRHAVEGDASHVMLVNNDVLVPPDCLEILEQSLARLPAAGVAAPTIMSRSHPDQVVSQGMSFSPPTGRMRHLGFGQPHEPTDADTVVDAVSGCVMLVRREVLDTIGLLDEDYFFSFEDLDYCRRARRAGFTAVHAARARVYHEGSHAMGAASLDRLYYAARNHLLAGQRDGGSAGRPARVGRSLSIIALNVAHAVGFPGGSLPGRLAAVAAGTYDYLRDRLGPRRRRG